MSVPAKLLAVACLVWLADAAHAQSQNTPPALAVEPAAATTEIQVLRTEIERASALLTDLRKRLEDVESRQSTTPAVSVSGATGTGRPAPATRLLNSVNDRQADPGPDRCALFTDGPRSPADATTSGTFDAPAAGCGRTVAAVLLTGSSGSSGVTVKLSRSSEGGEPNYSRGETLAHSNVYTLTASAPLAKDGPTQIASLDGFTTSSKLSFGFTRFMLPLPTDAGLRPSYVRLVNQAQAACRLQAAAETVAGKPLSYTRSCDEDNGVLFERFLTKQEVALMERILATQTVRRAIAFGLELSVGHEKFKFRDTASLAEFETSRVPLGAKGSLSIFPWPRTSLTAALDYQRVFKAAKTRIFCPTAVIGTSVECFTSPFALPGRTEKFITSGEFRRVLDFDKADFIPRLGIAPRVEYDVNSDDFAFNVPLYLAPDDKGKLIAGIQAGYTISETDATRPGKERDFRFGLFVGSAFTLP